MTNTSTQTIRNLKRGNGVNAFSYIFLILFGAVFLIVGVFVSGVSHINWDSVSGTIVDYVSEWNSEGELMHRSIIEYEVDGTSFTHHSNMSQSWRPTVGNEVVLRVNPNDPADAITISMFFFWIFGGFGVAALAGGIALMRFSKRQNRSFDFLAMNEANFIQQSTSSNNTNHKDNEIFQEWSSKTFSLTDDVSSNSSNSNDAWFNEKFGPIH